MSPYRTNTAPPIKPKWDGSRAGNVVYGGSETDLVVASNGKIYSSTTGEEVETLPLADLLKGKR